MTLADGMNRRKGRAGGERLPFSLRVYRAFTTAAAPLLGVLLARRLRKEKEHPVRFGERRAETSAKRPDGPLIWLHGASVGELAATFPLVTMLRRQGFQILITSGTVTSANLVKERLPNDVIHQFVPFDVQRFVTRFLDHWRPDLALFIESDLWPNLILECGRKRVPMIVINGRLSERSFTKWKVVPSVAQAVLRPFDLCVAQSSLDAERFSTLGIKRVHVSGNLKLDVPAPPIDQPALAALRTAIGNRPTFVAASTHPGEELAVIDTHRRLRQRAPGLLTIIAPRHPQRGREIFDLAARASLMPSVRSRQQLPDARSEIYVADTMGEMGLFYSVAPIVFMGGSLVEHGGQNPIEAIKLGGAVMHGPNVWNFAEIYAALDASNGAIELADAEALVAQTGAWLRDPASREGVAQAGGRTVNRLGGALQRTISELEPYLLQLRLNYRPNHA